MRNNLLSFIAAFLSVAAFAQQNRSYEQPEREFINLSQSNSRVPSDTIRNYNQSAGFTFFTVENNGGYLCGVNTFEDKAKAQKYLLSEAPLSGNPIAVEEVIIWFGGKKVNSANPDQSIIKVNVYACNGVGAVGGTVSQPINVNTAPNTVLGSADLSIANADTGAFLNDGGNIVQFSSPVYCSGDFAVGVNFTSLLPGDSIGIVSTIDGGIIFEDLSWEQWENNKWYTINFAWDIQVDMIIWPIVDAVSSVGRTLNGLTLLQNFPNPASNNLNINFSLEKATKKLDLFIFDSTGKLVSQEKINSNGVGQISHVVNTESLSNGTYFYTITTDFTKIGSKFQVIK